MAQKIVIFDTGLGRTRVSTTLIGSVGSSSDYDFDVTDSGGQTAFVTGATFDSSQRIDVWVNGRLQREGSTFDFQRSTPSTINFNYSVPQNSWVRIRV